MDLDDLLEEFKDERQPKSDWGEPKQGPKQDDPWGTVTSNKAPAKVQLAQKKETTDWDDDDDLPVAQKKPATKKKEDDLDDLINNFTGGKAPAASKPSFTYSVPQGPPQSKQAGGKCYPLYIGGAALKDGITLSSLDPHSCSSLRCCGCDKKVHRFPGNRWKSSVDYLFVRNHNTNLKELVKVSQSFPDSR